MSFRKVILKTKNLKQIHIMLNNYLVSNKISVCTVCKNRLFHIRETLPNNIESNRDYGNVNFILLDYNSTDGLGTWVANKMQKYIDSGLLTYYRTEEPTFFDLCHSKNMVANLCTNRITAIVDADNYAGVNYTQWINDVYIKSGLNSVITTIRKDYIPYRDTGGKLVFDNNLFKFVRGFDESLSGYGFDDVDLVNRLEINGGRRHFIDDKEFLRCISHTDIERLNDNYILNNIEYVYMKKTNNITTVIYILSGNKYILADFVYHPYKLDNQFSSYMGWNVAKDSVIIDQLTFNVDRINVIKSDIIIKTLFFKDLYKESLIDDFGDTWHQVKSTLIIDYILMYSECMNRNKYFDNDKNHTLVNPTGFGRGTVVKNFKHKICVTENGAISSRS